MQDSIREILEQLIAGNERFVSGKKQNPRSDLDHALKLIEEQNPKAAIFACSDSRYPLAEIFDQGIGDIFEIRVAGNSLNNDVIASIQYAASALETKLIMILGHTDCGACQAALSTDHFTYEINQLLRPLKEQINHKIRSSENPPYQLAVANVLHGISQLKDILPENTLVVGGIYHLESGKVDILS